jgi:glutaredoxin
MYTTHCPKCKLLTVKLEGLGIEINEVTDVELMKEKGFTTVPMLEVDGNIMDFSAAYKWANEIKEKNLKKKRGNK